ncbi:MAG: transposase domain-containing protein [Lachnospiraceae bacterium]|nr:transposase domain-containing protein [Lachnospiraceae bacterium]
MIDTISGAKASAVVYSIVETAKANGIRVYDYLEYLLTEIPEHMDDNNLDFLEDLMPWSDKLPERCRRSKEKR